MTTPPASSTEAREVELKRRVIALTGLFFYHDKDEQFWAAVERCMEASGVRDRDSYLQHILAAQHGDAEFERLIEELTIGETHFFRHPELFDALRTEILPALIARNSSARRLRIWSAGCANGAEPYSVAILLELYFTAQLSGWDTSIIATDINRRFLAQARAAEYQAWTLRGVSPEVRDVCFTTRNDRYRLRPEFARHVTFAHHNLMDAHEPDAVRVHGPLDVIICRNVMIYFDRETVHRLVRQFATRLGDGGWLLVGASETFVEAVDTLRPVPLPGAVVFRKAEAGEVRATQVLAAASPGTTSPPSAAPRRASATAPALESDASRAPCRACVAEATSACVNQDELGAMFEAINCGQFNCAEALCHAASSRCSLDPRLHLVQGILHEQRHDLIGAEQAFRRAVYLDRHMLYAHYALGDVLERQGRCDAARRSFLNGLQSLDRHDGSCDVPMMAGVTVEALRELLSSRLNEVAL